MTTYTDSVRRFDVSLLSVIPLVSIYIVGAFLMHRAPPNGADMFTPLIWKFFGTRGVLVFGIFLLLLALFLYARLSREHQFRITYILFLLIEGVFYSFCMLIFVWFFLNLLRPFSVHPPRPHDFGSILVVSSGAGVWEEMLFRVVILGGIYGLFAGEKKRLSLLPCLVAVGVSSFLFSVVHFLAEPPTAGAFWFRFLAGAFLGGLYLSRGYGVCAYCHFTFDVMAFSFT